jgi:cell division protein FtsQ
MWDKPHLLRLIANVLFNISLLLVLYSGARHVLYLPMFSLRAVELTAIPLHVDAIGLERVVHENVKGNFFSVDLDRTRLAFEQLPWVRKVSVRRKFPWNLQVDLEEHIAVARWNRNGSPDKQKTELVNTFGEVFSANCKEALPEFIGQNENSAQIASMYVELSGILKPLQQTIVQINLSPRLAWQLRLNNGMTLALGREQMQSRLTRFVAAYPYSLANLPRSANNFDLRYRDGFAANVPGRTEMRTGKDS